MGSGGADPLSAEGAGTPGSPEEERGAGQQQHEKEQQAWMLEDDDIWGVPEQDIGPVIG